MLLALLITPSSFLLGGTPALRQTPRAAVIAHGHGDHPLSDKFDTSKVWNEQWDKYSSDPGYSLGKYSRSSLVEAYGLKAATEPNHIVQALTDSLNEYSRESLASRDAWLAWLPKLSSPLLEKLASIKRELLGPQETRAGDFTDEWLEGCLLEAGDDEVKRGACMA